MPDNFQVVNEMVEDDSMFTWHATFWTSRTLGCWIVSDGFPIDRMFIFDDFGNLVARPLRTLGVAA